jgi:hypothetical protein
MINKRHSMSAIIAEQVKLNKMHHTESQSLIKRNGMVSTGLPILEGCVFRNEIIRNEIILSVLVLIRQALRAWGAGKTPTPGNLQGDSAQEDVEAFRQAGRPDHGPSTPASAGGTNRDLAATQFTKNCVAYNIIEF